MIALVYGGGGSEHEVSKLSADFLIQKLSELKLDFCVFELQKDFSLLELSTKKTYYTARGSSFIQANNQEAIKISYLIPYIHGAPVESGQWQATLAQQGFRYLGSDFEASIICYNKISTKLWAQKLDIPVVPFEIISAPQFAKQRAIDFFNKEKKAFVKATHQGCSIGSYLCQTKDELLKAIEESSKLSPYTLLEKALKPREIEVTVFEYQGKIHVTHPCEIIPHTDGFYDFDQKYGEDSQTKLELTAKIPDQTKNLIMSYSKELYQSLKIKDLARVDFFIEGEQTYLNEINTMPGLTQISMFPKMMEHYGVLFSDYLKDRIKYD